MSEIITVARSSSNAVRSHIFPVLEAGNTSYPNGQYAVTFREGDDRSSFVLNHRIDGAGLIGRLLKEDKACYACAVSSPMSSYRQVHVSKQPSQRIAWDEDDLGEPPLFTPMIVSTESCALSLCEKRDGVHRIWDGQEVTIPKASRLALGHVIQLKSSILHLLSLHATKDLEEGEFFVDAETEHGFRFRVNLSPRLHQFLQVPDQNGIRNHVMTHVVTACLALLQRDFSEDSYADGGWRSHRNLRAFAAFLNTKDLPHWSDDEFRPEWVSTRLHPHGLPKEDKL